MLLFLKLVVSFSCLDHVFSICLKDSVTTVSGTLAPSKKLCSGELIFEDNFDSFNLRTWEHEQSLAGGGNWEFQWYTNNRTISYTKNGSLFIKPRLTADEYGNDFVLTGTLDINAGNPADRCTNPRNYGCLRTGNNFAIINPIKSALIKTVSSFRFKYGKVEIKAKLPAGDWLWPAIWMLPLDNQYGNYPASGEIDIVESRGNKNFNDSKGEPLGSQLLTSALHFGPGVSTVKSKVFKKMNHEGFDSNFHTYQFEWTPKRLMFKVDDIKFGEFKAPKSGNIYGKNLMGNPWSDATPVAPFDQEFYLIINLAVGGVSFFPDDATNANGKPWKNTSPKAAGDFWAGKEQWLTSWKTDFDLHVLQIDHIKVWAL